MTAVDEATAFAALATVSSYRYKQKGRDSIAPFCYARDLKAQAFFLMLAE